MPPGGRGQFARFSETIRWHSAVHRFVFAGANLICLVPDADIAAALSNPLVEIDPGRPMPMVLTARVRLQVVERPPVLHDDAEGIDAAQKPAFRAPFKFF